MRWRRLEGHVELDHGASVELSRLTALEGFSRAVIVGVVPLSALDALGSTQAVTYVFIGGALITLLLTLNLGALERALERRWVVTVGFGSLVVASILFSFADGALYAVAIGLRSAEASIFSVCLSLYIMDCIGRDALTRSESRRMVHVGMAWLIGPSFGVWLWSTQMQSGPFVATILTSMLALGYFWRMRTHNHPVLLVPVTKVPSPIHNIPRFFGQKNLRIAYAITTTRSIFWSALFVYGPIYVVEAGLPTWMAGTFLSIASATLFISPIVRRLADTVGTRAVVICAFALMSPALAILAALKDPRPTGVVFWLVAALAGAALDVVGNIPFMRTVEAHERTAMTTVFSTWREVSFLLSPLLAAVALAFGSFWLLYLTISILAASTAVLTTRLPPHI